MHNVVNRGAVFWLLNPFVFSGIFNFGTDLSVVWLFATMIILVRGYTLNWLPLIALVLIDRTLLIYALSLLAIFSVSQKLLNEVIDEVIPFWFALFILQIVLPGYHSILFFRDMTTLVGRGLSGFGSEPATSAMFLVCSLFYLKKLRNKVLVLVMLVMTQSIPLILIGTFKLLSAMNLRRRLGALGLLIMFGTLFLDSLGDRALMYLRFLTTIDENLLLSDTSFVNRLKSLPVILNQIQHFHILPLNHISNPYFVFLGGNHLTEIVGGLGRLYNFFGIIALFLYIFMVKTISGYSKAIVFLMSFFVGSPAHIFPLILFTHKNE